jgi:hypothetical protein
MKPELYIDVVPAADVVRYALAHGWARMPFHEKEHIVTPQERAELKRETKRAFSRMLAEQRQIRLAGKTVAPKRPAKDHGIEIPDHPGLMP